MQLYFYNTEHEIKNRLQYSPKLDKLILSKLLNILQIDPYCSFFRHLKDIPNLEYKKTCIRSDPQLDQRLYNNVSSISQVAAIWLTRTSLRKPLVNDTSCPRVQSRELEPSDSRKNSEA